MTLFWLCCAALGAGAVNSVAGGGTLLTFPTLVWALGGSPEAAVVANATSTVALMPGSIASMWGYRRELVGTQPWIERLLLPSFLGGLLGSQLLVSLPAEWFERLVPWLILTATALLAVQPQLVRWVSRHSAEPNLPESATGGARSWGVGAFQFLVGVYGGYFGAGIGILMLAALALIGLTDFHQMNALKALFAATINFIAMVIFIVGDQVSWTHAAPMAIASIVGGFWGASIARRLDRSLVRRAVIVIGLVLTSYYFWQEWG